MEENRLLRSQLDDPLVKQTTTFCGICQAELTQIEFNQHVCIHQRPISCEYCSASFQSTIELRLHFSEAKHSNITFYQCDKCEKSFPTSLLLQFHLSSQQNHPSIQPEKIESPVTTSNSE